MPNFETHYWIGKKVGVAIGVLSGLVTLILTFDLAWAFVGLFVGYYSTVVGSVAPDIDLSQPSSTLKYASIPYRQLVLLIKLLLVVILALGLAVYNRDGLSIERAIVSLSGIGLALVVIRLIPDLLHSFMPKHRGTTHRFAFWILMSLGTGYVINRLLMNVGFSSVVLTLLPSILAVGVLMGVFTHVSSDSVSSIAKRYAPEAVRTRLPWVPRKLPVLLDIPWLLKVFVDRRAPASIKLLILITVAYGVMPIDIITDVIPVLGWGDDFSVYLYLRRTIYNSYDQNIGILDSIRRDYLLLDRVILPALILGIISLAVLIWYVV